MNTIKYINTTTQIEHSKLNGFFVGFINVLSDGILSAYIPLLEVLPECQGHGIGKKLIDLILARYEHLYMPDVCCNESVEQLYASKGFTKISGLVHRNYKRQGVT